jgi:hypothetical protein
MTDPKDIKPDTPPDVSPDVPPVSDTGTPPPDKGGYPSLDEYSKALEGIDPDTLADLFYTQPKMPNMLDVYASMQRRGLTVDDVTQEYKEGYKAFLDQSGTTDGN